MDPIRDASPPVKRAIWKRLTLLAATVVALYLLWPSLLTMFSAWPSLLEIDVIWFVWMVVAEVASFACMWGLLRVTLRTSDLVAVATSQLAGNALSRIVPGGAAAGPALQFRMLEQTGIPPANVASGLATTSLIGLITVLFLPALAIPAALLGRPIPPGLERATLLGGVVFVLLIAVGVVLLTVDAPLRALGRILQWVRNRSGRGRAPRTDIPNKLVRERNDVRRTLGSMWWKAVLFAAGNSVFDYLALLATLTAVGSSPRPTLVLLGFVAARILSLIPITPGGIGFVEAGLTGTLVLAGVAAADAVLATLAYRLVSFWLPLPAGLAGIVLHRRRYSSVKA